MTEKQAVVSHMGGADDTISASWTLYLSPPAPHFYSSRAPFLTEGRGNGDSMAQATKHTAPNWALVTLGFLLWYFCYSVYTLILGKLLNLPLCGCFISYEEENNDLAEGSSENQTRRWR